MKNNFESKFGYKIKSIKELKKEIGNFPKKKKSYYVPWNL